MAWKLRQPFEGDRIITVNDVIDSAQCWVDGGGVYIPNSIAVKINGVEHPLATVDTLDLGFLIFQVPVNVYINATNPVQVYAVCEDLPESKTATLNAKPVDFQILNSAVTSCNPQVILNSDINDWIRIYMTDTAGDYFNLKINGANSNVDLFDYQPGDSGNIGGTAGNWSRPGVSGSPASLISKSIYAGDNTVTITPLSTKYFTVRLGYLEVILNGTNIFYNNYLNSSEVEVAAGTYSVGDVFTIESIGSNYVLKKNGTVLTSKPKTISYAVNGGTVNPSTSTIGTPVAWTLPTTPGSYTFLAQVGNSLLFQKTVMVHSCANAVNDNFTGVYNTAYVGNVTLNDIACTGENNYIVVSNVIGGSVVIENTGAFVFTPTTNYNGVASFTYTRKCGASSETAEVIASANVNINYFNACNGVTANYQDNGVVRCQNCVNEKQRIDLNAQCTGNAPIWVTNPQGNSCSTAVNLVPTGETRCQNCVDQREVQDLNPCSSSYLTKFWQDNPSGTACNSTATWVDNGVFQCNNCVEEKQQIDNATCSTTYNTTRWVTNVGGTQCVKSPTWEDINEFVCLNCVEYKKQRDVNTCSNTYLQVRNVENPTGNLCNTDTIWEDTGVTRCNNKIHEKQQMSSNACSGEATRWVATGLEICECTGYLEFSNICDENDVVTSVTVYKQATVEGNRLISFSNKLLKFKADVGTFVYKIVINYQEGAPNTIQYTFRCNPLI